MLELTENTEWTFLDNKRTNRKIKEIAKNLGN